jgi:hypothetical protein
MQPESERRTTPRCECLFGTMYRTAGEEGGYRVGLVMDLSPQGASLLLPCDVGSGARLTLKLRRKDGESDVCRDFVVKHLQPFGEAAWLAGGVFEPPLEVAEQALLQDP